MSEFWTVLVSQEPAGLVVTGLIGVLLLLGAWDALRAAAALRRELRHLAGARTRLRATGPSLTAEPAGALEELQLPAASLVGGRIARVLQLRQAGLGQREALSKISLEALGARGALARYIATILTLLGLVGTVVGMSLSMLRITGAFKNVDNIQALSELTQALSGTLEGMKTAFACTLAGLVGAVLLSALNHVIRRYQSRLQQDLESFVTCELLPILEAIDPEADQAARAFASVLVTSTDRLVQVCDRFTSAAERYEAGSHRLSGAVETLADGTRHSLGGVDEAVRGLRAGVEQFVAQQRDTTQTLGEIRDAVQSLSRVVDEELRRVNESNERSHRLLAERLTALESTAKTNLDVATTITGYQAGFRELVEETIRQQQDAFARMRDDAKRHVDETQDHLAELLREHATRLHSFSNMMLDLHLDGRAGHVS